MNTRFPFLLGRAFIEARRTVALRPIPRNFPSFSEGLSLRQLGAELPPAGAGGFPFLFGRAFIEAHRQMVHTNASNDFPSFLEGILLRRHGVYPAEERVYDFFAF